MERLRRGRRRLVIKPMRIGWGNGAVITIETLREIQINAINHKD